MALQANKDNYFDTGSLAKPPKFNIDNFSLWETRMELFLVGSDPQILHFLEKGPYIHTTIVHDVPATTTTTAIAERTIEKDVTQWTDEEKRLVNIDTKTRSLLSMSLPDDVFHSVCHLRFVKKIWNTLCVQFDGTDVLLESRKINLVRQYKKFICMTGETLSQVHQQFNCLRTIYLNFEVITKFMEALLESWETYTMCLKMSKDIKTISFSELYGIMLNYEQTMQLKKNLIKDTKDYKITSVALVSESIP